MKVSHSTYMDSNGSLGLMKAELEINTNIPFIPKLSLDYSILKKMNEVGVISMDIKRIEKLNILYKHNIELVNNFKKFEKILKNILNMNIMIKIHSDWNFSLEKKKKCCSLYAK